MPRELQKSTKFFTFIQEKMDKATIDFHLLKTVSFLTVLNLQKYMPQVNQPAL